MVSKWLNDAALPRADYLASIALGLDISGHWLLTGEGEMMLPGAPPAVGADLFGDGFRAALASARLAIESLEVPTISAAAASRLAGIQLADEIDEARRQLAEKRSPRTSRRRA